jgi:hypothetical protein
MVAARFLFFIHNAEPSGDFTPNLLSMGLVQARRRMPGQMDDSMQAGCARLAKGLAWQKDFR